MNYKKGDTVYYIGAQSSHKDKPGIVMCINSDGPRIKFEDGRVLIVAVKSLVLTKEDYFKYLLDGENK